MKILVLGGLFLSLITSQGASMKLTYISRSTQFSMTKTDRQLQYRSQLGIQNLSIQQCNSQLIDLFWNQTLLAVSKLKFAGVLEKHKMEVAHVKLGRKRIPLVRTEPGYSQMERLPRDIAILDVRSRLLCRGNKP